jgi:hypothetical protein
MQLPWENKPCQSGNESGTFVWKEGSPNAISRKPLDSYGATYRG